MVVKVLNQYTVRSKVIGGSRSTHLTDKEKEEFVNEVEYVQNNLRN